MTALERWEEHGTISVFDAHQSAAVHRLAEWATSAQAAASVAEQLVKTSFVPEAFRGKPYEATAAILSGLEMGLSPMASLRSFDVIQGQAAPRAITLRAVVQAHGHEMVLDEATATRCVMRGRRNGANTWQKVVWTIDRARSLGLVTKHTWKTQPQNMLVARATSELARLIAADAILGIAYTAEELIDGADPNSTPPSPEPNGDAAAETTEATAPGTRRMSRRKPPAPTEQPALDDGPEPPADAELVLSDAQMRKLRAQYGGLGIGDAAEQKRVTAIILDLDSIETHSTLSVDQASTVIERLNAVEDGFVEFVVDDDMRVIGLQEAEHGEPVG